MWIRIRVFWAGVRDGFEQPIDFSIGMTYADDTLNELYDRGVNLGQAIGRVRV
jgi:hypothetical protein